MEITCRTVQRRFLLKPSEELNDRILGIVGRAMTMYPVDLHLFIVVSNHMHLILSAHDSQTVSSFMRYVNSNLAREAGRLYAWRDAFWSRRYRGIAILDEAALVGRMRYVLAHGCKEGLVERPEQWPGVHCVHALTKGEELKGHWIDRTGMHNAKRAGVELDEQDFRIPYTIALTPPPCWADRTEEQQRVLWREMVEGIAIEEAEKRILEDLQVIGARNVLAQDPHSRPEGTNSSRAPMCHTTDSKLRAWYKQAYRLFVDAYRYGVGKLRETTGPRLFPDNSFPSPQPFLSWAGES